MKAIRTVESVPPVKESATESSGADGGVECVVETEFGTLDSLQVAWDERVEVCGAPIYMTYDWVRTWWAFYGAGRELRVFLARKAGRLVGILPFYVEQFGVGPWAVRVARLVGANVPPKVFNPPVDPQYSEDVFKSVFRQLFQRDRCDLLSFGPVSTTWAGKGAFERTQDSAADLWGHAEWRQTDVQTLFRLPSSFEEYLESLSKTERKNRMKRVRRLEREHEVDADVISRPELIPGEFERFLVKHGEQWRAVGKGGHFVAWPRAEEFNRALVREQARHGRVHFFRLVVDGAVVVSRYTFRLGHTLFSELPARSIGEPWDKLGVGAVSLMKFNESAIGEGVVDVDSGLGGYEHKTQLGGQEVPTGVWRMVARRWGSRTKTRVFLLLAGLVQLVCLKLWYRRVLPRLPQKFRRSQPMVALRFHV